MKSPNVYLFVWEEEMLTKFVQELQKVRNMTQLAMDSLTRWQMV